MKSVLKNLFFQFLFLALLSLSLIACSTTPADKAKLLKGSLDASRAGCTVLMLDRSIPREPKTLTYCNRLLNGKVGVRLMALEGEEVPEDPPVVSPGDCPPVVADP